MGIEGSHSGTVVVFDPEEDVAVLRVPGLAGEALPLERRRLQRGATGATLGYPGSARELRAYPAAVQRRFVASGYDIYGPPPPSSGGICLVEMLNILENFDLKAMGYNSANYIHTVYQAMNLAFADRDFYYGDPDFETERPM
jgi:hypothetical protein